VTWLDGLTVGVEEVRVRVPHHRGTILPVGIERQGSCGARVGDILEGVSKPIRHSDLTIRRVQPLPASHTSRDLSGVDDATAGNVNSAEHPAVLNLLLPRRRPLPAFPHWSRHLNTQPPRLDGITQHSRVQPVQEPRWQVVLREPQLVERVAMTLLLVGLSVLLRAVPSTALVPHGDHVWRRHQA
jgi:hypothetical protein